MKVTFFETDKKDQEEILIAVRETESLNTSEVEFINEALNMETVTHAKDSEIVCIFIGSMVGKDIINLLPNLKLIVTRSTGFDHIDYDYARGKGIQVCNVPAYGSRTVAEFTFGLILGLSRKLLAASYQVKDNHNFDMAGLEGFDLQGKTLGIIGTGKIGLNVAQIAKGFEMKILGYDAFPNEENAKKFELEYTELDTLLKKSDVITLHVPYNKDTHHLINAERVKNIKPGALLINTARGEVCDTKALLFGINENIIGGLGLDVMEGERELKDPRLFEEGKSMSLEQLKIILADHMLLDSPKVFITPHIAFLSKEAKAEITKTSVANISAFGRGETINLIK